MPRGRTFGKARDRRVLWAWIAIAALIIVVSLLLTGCQVPLRN